MKGSEEMNGAEMVDVEEARVLPNQRLLDPALTPEKLRTFAFGVGVPMPTRTCSRETTMALKMMAYPMFGHPIHYSPDSMEVGDARNHIVEMALADNVEYLFFLDYDVVPPPNAFIKLLSLKVPIAAGVYHLKAVPPQPLIMVNGWSKAFEEYDYGDLVKADAVGMGCTLIHMDVFRKIPKPWFKTSPGYSEKTSAILPGMTEDIYFCAKARAAGYDIIVDTSIQCGHMDVRGGIEYVYVPDPNGGKRGTPGWRYRRGNEYIVETVADASHPGRKYADTKPYVPNEDWIDLGSGMIPPDGYTGIDLYVDSPVVLKGDITDLSWYRKEHGLARKIRASHSLEHISHRDIVRVFRDWVATLRPGGEMEIRVPDGEFHMREFIARIDKGEDQDPQADWLNHTLYGYQIGGGQEHKTLFTANRLQCLAESCGLVDVSVQKVIAESGHPAFPTTAELVLTGRAGGGKKHGSKQRNDKAHLRGGEQASLDR